MLHSLGNGRGLEVRRNKYGVEAVLVEIRGHATGRSDVHFPG